MSLLGIDVGTTGCKAILFSEEGTLIGTGYREYPLYHPQPGWAELNPQTVWDGVRVSVREALAGAGSGDRSNPRGKPLHHPNDDRPGEGDQPFPARHRSGRPPQPPDGIQVERGSVCGDPQAQGQLLVLLE